MFPLHDNNPTTRLPVVTVVIILVNVAALIWLARLPEQEQTLAVVKYGFVPERIQQLSNHKVVTVKFPPQQIIDQFQRVVVRVQRPIDLPPLPSAVYRSILTSMFLHGGWLHLLGNMWFLWLFGNNVEDSMGHARYLVFYLLSGLAAAAAQTLVNPNSAIPMVGASGAISGVMGAYIVLYPRVRVHMLIFLGFFITRAVVPAYVMLGYWFLLQLVGGLPSMGGEAGGVAFWAHAGGFLTGAALILVFRDQDLVARHRALARYV